MLRVIVSKVRMPRSHRITWELPRATMYSAAISNSLMVALRPRLSMHGLAQLAHRLQQREVLHVARADLEDVGVARPRASSVAVSFTSVMTRRPVSSRASASSLQALLLQALELVGAGAGLEGAAAQHAWRPPLFTALAVEMICSCDSTEQGPAMTFTRLAAEHQVAHADDGVLGLHLAAHQLEGLGDAHRVRHAGQHAEGLGLHRAGVAGDADGRARPTGDRVRLPAAAVDLVVHTLDVLGRRVGSHHDQHGCCVSTGWVRPRAEGCRVLGWIGEGRSCDTEGVHFLSYSGGV